MDKSLIICLLFLLLCTTGCSKQKGTSQHTIPVKVADYLYEITYDDYCQSTAEHYALTLNSISHGAACTVIRHGNIIGRNYDYLYSDMAEFVIHVPATEGRYASIGVAASIFELTPKVTENDPYGQYFDILPYVTVDGMNEKGLYCNVNMVHGEQGYRTTGTNPASGINLYASFAVRYVLDHCATAAEACNAIQNANIIFLEALGEFHFFIADREESWVAEVFDNSVRCHQWDDEVMTNFYVLTDRFIEEHDPGTEPEGIERYEYALNHISEIKTTDDAARIMSNLKYSKCYDPNTDPFWYSEYYGEKCSAGTIDINMPKEQYASHIKEQCDGFKNKTRDYLEGYWITTHTSIYDLQNLTLRVYSQENYNEHFDFRLK